MGRGTKLPLRFLTHTDFSATAPGVAAAMLTLSPSAATPAAAELPY